MGREASPTAAIIDSQSVKGAEKWGRSIDPPGYDAGKKIRSKKRHILVDTQGPLMHALVHPADIAHEPRISDIPIDSRSPEPELARCLRWRLA